MQNLIGPQIRAWAISVGFIVPHGTKARAIAALRGLPIYTRMPTLRLDDVGRRAARAHMRQGPIDTSGEE
jgi:hypothetical protein